VPTQIYGVAAWFSKVICASVAWLVYNWTILESKEAKPLTTTVSGSHDWYAVACGATQGNRGFERV